MDIATLTTTAVAVVTPYLSEGTKEAVKSGAKDLYGWMKAKLVGTTALADLKKAPDDPDNQADLRKQLRKLLEANPALVAELQALLPEDAAGAVAQKLVQKGHHNTGVQAVGSKVTIQR